MERLVVVRRIAAVTATVAALSVPVPAAAADPIQDCTTTTGVIVAVDFSHFGGHVERGCAARPGNGLAALSAAGFDFSFVTREPGFVCRIDGDPTPAEQGCQNTPPASAYWSYWHADPGARTWSYTQEGAGSYHPPSGSVDAWVFGSTQGGGASGAPTFSPDSVRAHNAAAAPSPTASAHHGGSSTPTPQPAHRRHPRGAGTRAGGQASAAASAQPRATGRGDRHSAPTHPSRRVVKAPHPPTPSTSEPLITDVAPAAAARRSTAGGSAAGVVAGVAIAAALAGAAGAVAWRRRRASWR